MLINLNTTYLVPWPIDSHSAACVFPLTKQELSQRKNRSFLPSWAQIVVGILIEKYIIFKKTKLCNYNSGIHLLNVFLCRPKSPKNHSWDLNPFHDQIKFLVNVKFIIQSAVITLIPVCPGKQFHRCLSFVINSSH